MHRHLEVRIQTARPLRDPNGLQAVGKGFRIDMSLGDVTS